MCVCVCVCVWVCVPCTGGELQSTPFGLDDLPPAKQILVTEHAKTDFSSISVVKRIGKERVYKVQGGAHNTRTYHTADVKQLLPHT